jgi:S-adenosylmethionine hydrolase
MRRIALLTDFGLKDPYVAAMKGVIAGRTGAPVHDLSHDIAPFDVFEGAWFLASVAGYWPEGTIFVAIVDPGVGTARRILALEQDGKIFLAPDNGLLSLVARSPAAHSVEDPAFFLPAGSTTFHGRDRFAPVAAALANGTPPGALGPAVQGIVRLDYEPPSYGEVVRGSIVAIDRFGNAVTDIQRSAVSFARFAARVHGHTIERLANTYAEGGAEAFLIVGSTGRIEISVGHGSAAERLHLSRLDRVELRPQGRSPSARAPFEME